MRIPPFTGLQRGVRSVPIPAPIPERPPLHPPETPLPPRKSSPPSHSLRRATLTVSRLRFSPPGKSAARIRRRPRWAFRGRTRLPRIWPRGTHPPRSSRGRTTSKFKLYNVSVHGLTLMVLACFAHESIFPSQKFLFSKQLFEQK